VKKQNCTSGTTKIRNVEGIIEHKNTRKRTTTGKKYCRFNVRSKTEIIEVIFSITSPGKKKKPKISVSITQFKWLPSAHLRFSTVSTDGYLLPMNYGLKVQEELEECVKKTFFVDGLVLYRR
jgi:hypothetical protein